MASATLLNSTASTSVNATINLNSLTSDYCLSNSLCTNSSLNSTGSGGGGSCSNSRNLSINYNSNLQSDHQTISKINLPDINNNSNNQTMNQNDLISSDTSTNLNNNLNLNDNLTNSNSPEIIKLNQLNSTSPQNYHSNKKTNEQNSNKLTSFSMHLYSEIAMDVKVINSDCIIYTFCSDIDIAIEDHFKKALNTSIFKHKGMFYCFINIFFLTAYKKKKFLHYKSKT